MARGEAEEVDAAKQELKMKWCKKMVLSWLTVAMVVGAAAARTGETIYE